MVYYGNRGQMLENMIEAANGYYSWQGKALVQKIPTPVKVLHIDERTGRITSGFYEKKSTVDYIGLYKGVPIAFDAKQTNIETRFDLSNIHDHQYNYLANFNDNGGISFLIVHFTTLDETYYLPFDTLKYYWNNKLKGGRKSIPYDDIAKEEYRISKGRVAIDYLDVIKEVI